MPLPRIFRADQVEDLLLPISISELAFWFSDLTAAEHIQFFNILAKEIEETWPHGLANWAMQLQFITDGSEGETLTPSARYLMSQIGEYAKKTSPTEDQPSNP